MKQPKISIVIVTWNGRDYIKSCLDSVLAQKIPQEYLIKDDNGKSYPFYEILVVDNGSDDDTVNIIKEKYHNKVNLVVNKKNFGFSRGYNRAIHWTSGRYVLILNQDVILKNDFLVEATNLLDSYKKIGVVVGKVFKLIDNKKSNIIDSQGLRFDKFFTFFNINENKEDKDNNKDIVPVFGFSGAVAMCRRSALNDISYKKQFFDELFFSYKEDIDISWRLRWRNWDIVFAPQIIAYHKRSVGILSHNSWRKKFFHHKGKNKLINLWSYRNHIVLLLKNLPFKYFIIYSPFIFFSEIKKFLFYLFVSPNVLSAWIDIIKNFSLIMSWRKHINKTKKVNSDIIKLWINK